MPELISSDNVHLLSEDDMDDDPLDFESRDQQVSDFYEESEDYFDANIEMVQALRSEEHHKNGFDNKSEQIQTSETSESNTECIQKEAPCQNPVVRRQDLDLNPVDGDASVFSLSTNGFDVSNIDNVNHITTENSTNSLLICREEHVLQVCTTDPNLLDSMDKGIFLVEIIGGTPITMMIDTVASCSVVPMLFMPNPSLFKQHEYLSCAFTSKSHKSAIQIRVFDPGGFTFFLFMIVIHIY